MYQWELDGPALLETPRLRDHRRYYRTLTAGAPGGANSADGT